MFVLTIFVAMNIGENIKKIREQKGLLQKQVAASVGMHPSNYSKIEKGERLPSIEVTDKLAQLFDMTVDQIIHLNGHIPQEVTTEDKTTAQQLKLLQQLDEEDRKALFRIIDTMITKKKMKDFLKENVKE